MNENEHNYRNDQPQVRFRVTKEIMKLLKVHCAEEGLCIQVVLESLLIKYLEQVKKT